MVCVYVCVRECVSVFVCVWVGSWHYHESFLCTGLAKWQEKPLRMSYVSPVFLHDLSTCWTLNAPCHGAAANWLITHRLNKKLFVTRVAMTWNVLIYFHIIFAFPQPYILQGHPPDLPVCTGAFTCRDLNALCFFFFIFWNFLFISQLRTNINT